jgi:hypothetical protein
MVKALIHCLQLSATDAVWAAAVLPVCALSAAVAAVNGLQASLMLARRSVLNLAAFGGWSGGLRYWLPLQGK